MTILAGAVRAADGPALLADFQLVQRLEERVGSGARAVISNAVFTADGLLLERGYENAGEGYQAQFIVPGLRPDSVAFVVDFAPLSLADGRGAPPLPRRVERAIRSFFGLSWAGQPDSRNLITAGKSYRWLGFNHGPGHLQLTLNNQSFRRDFTNVVLRTKQWHRLACSVDVAERRIQVAVDGVLLDPLRLPEGLQLEVPAAAGSDESSFTLANYSNGQAFSGYLARLQVYDRALGADELQVLAGPVAPAPLRRGVPSTAWVLAALAVLFLLARVAALNSSRLRRLPARRERPPVACPSDRLSEREPPRLAGT